MRLLKLALRPLAVKTVQRLVPLVSGRPWLVAIAARAFAQMPSLKRRLRHLMSAPMSLPVAARGRPLSAAEAGVLADLREAAQRRGAARR